MSARMLLANNNKKKISALGFKYHSLLLLTNALTPLYNLVLQVQVIKKAIKNLTLGTLHHMIFCRNTLQCIHMHILVSLSCPRPLSLMLSCFLHFIHIAQE